MLHGIVGIIIILMSVLIQRLTDDIVLETIVFSTTRGECLIRTPSQKTMVHDSIVCGKSTSITRIFVRRCTIPIIPMSIAETHESRNSIIGIRTKRLITQHDTNARSGLSCDSYVWIATCQCTLQGNDTTYIKYDGARTR